MNCPNTCMELGRAAREAEEARLQVIQEGLNKRQGMVDQARAFLEEKRVKLQEKEMLKIELEKMKDEKQRLKEEAEVPEKEALDYYKKIEEEEKQRQEEEKTAKEAAEASEYFSMLDTDNDGAVSVSELMMRPGLDTNKDGQVTEEEAKFFLGDKDGFDMDSFRDGGFALIKPYLDLEKVMDEPEIITGEAADHEAPSQEYHPPDHPMMTPSPEEVYDPEAPDHPMNTPAPPTEDDYQDDDDEEDADEDYDISDHEEQEKVEEEVAKPESRYDDNTQKLIDAAEEARKQFTSAERQLRDLEREVKQLQESLEKDYGGDSVFAVLQGQCFEYTDNEYVYKMCPFDMVRQSSHDSSG